MDHGDISIMSNKNKNFHTKKFKPLGADLTDFETATGLAGAFLAGRPRLLDFAEDLSSSSTNPVRPAAPSIQSGKTRALPSATARSLCAFASYSIVDCTYLNIH